MEGVYENLDDRLTGNIEETDKRIDRITEKLKAKTKGLEIVLSWHVVKAVIYSYLDGS